MIHRNPAIWCGAFLVAAAFSGCGALQNVADDIRPPERSFVPEGYQAFSCKLLELTLVRADGTVQACSPKPHGVYPFLIDPEAKSEIQVDIQPHPIGAGRTHYPQVALLLNGEHILLDARTHQIHINGQLMERRVYTTPAGLQIAWADDTLRLHRGIEWELHLTEGPTQAFSAMRLSFLRKDAAGLRGLAAEGCRAVLPVQPGKSLMAPLKR